MGFVIERTARFEDAEILGRNIQIRVKYSVREMATLNKHLDKFRNLSEKLDKDVDDNRIKAYETSIAECLTLIVKGEEDRKFVKDAVLDVDPESDDVLDIREFVDFVQYALKVDDEEAEEDTGKASSGSEAS